MHLLRAFTVPIIPTVTPEVDHTVKPLWNRGFARLRAALNIPCFLAFCTFWAILKIHEEEYPDNLVPFQEPSIGPFPLPIFVGLVTAPIGIIVWVLTPES